MADEILSESDQKSPIEHLPVAAGKRRRGRPRKTHVAAAVMDAVKGDGPAPAAADLASVVENAVEKVLKRGRTPSPGSVKGINAAVRQVERSDVRRAVKLEVGASAHSGRDAEVLDALADAEKKEIAAQPTFGPGHPRWHELRSR